MTERPNTSLLETAQDLISVALGRVGKGDEGNLYVADLLRAAQRILSIESAALRKNL